MALENPQFLKEKNRKRLRDVINSTFILGINVTAPSLFKDYLRIITIILIIASWGCIYGGVCYILRHKESIAMMAESICTMLQTLISIFKLSYIPFVQHRFYKILKSVETHELVDKIEFLSQETLYNGELRKKARKILDDCWRNAKIQFNFFASAVISVTCFYIGKAITVNGHNWYIGNTNHTNILPFPTLFPFWEDKMNNTPYFLVLSFIVGCGDFISGFSAISLDGLFLIMALHGVALIRILRHMIIFTTSPNVPKKLRLDYLRQCADHYERTFQYCRDFNNLYLHISLVQFLLSLVIIGVIMFQTSISLKGDTSTCIRMILYMTAASFEVYIYCFNGQLISNEIETIPLAFYECEWYNESKEFKQLIKMMIMRTNPVFIMKASWFSTMTLPTLMALFKTSGSYFVLLRNLGK